MIIRIITTKYTFHGLMTREHSPRLLDVRNKAVVIKRGIKRERERERERKGNNQIMNKKERGV